MHKSIQCISNGDIINVLIDIRLPKTFFKHIEAETKWPRFRRRHFQMPFLEYVFVCRHIYASLGSNELISAFFSVRETALGTQIIQSALMMCESRGSLFPKWKQLNSFAFWFWHDTILIFYLFVWGFNAWNKNNIIMWMLLVVCTSQYGAIFIQGVGVKNEMI